MAWLSDSVPELVNITSRGVQLRSLAIFSLASSTAFFGPLPAQWMLEGLPQSSLRYGSMASKTSSCTGVVALWSKYIFFKAVILLSLRQYGEKVLRGGV